MIVCMVEAFLEKRSCQTQLIMLVEDLARNAGFGRADSTGLILFELLFEFVDILDVNVLFAKIFFDDTVPLM